MTASSPPESTWYRPAQRVPARNQVVRIRTRSGQIWSAAFQVAYTEDWPAGVSWNIGGGRAPLRFSDVSAWTDVPEKKAGPAEVDPTPAIVREAVDEIEHTRDVLALLPPDRLRWAPHPDIPSLQVIAWRLVRTVQRISWIASRDEVDRSVLPRIQPMRTPELIADTFSEVTAQAEEALSSLTADDLRQAWTLLDEGIQVVDMPRGDVLRSFGIRPLVYHRAEMCLLLTALDLTPPHPYPEWELHPELERRIRAAS